MSRRTSLRIALVAPFGLRAKGTAQARALPLGRALARCGHQVALFLPPYDSPQDAGRRWTDQGVEVVNLALPAAGRGGAAWHLWLGWRLFLAARRWQPDVVHVFKPKGPSGLAGMLFWVTRGRAGAGAGKRGDAGAQRGVCPRVIMDSDDWEGPGGWNDDPRTGYTAAQRRFFAWQERYGLTHADGWTVTSRCLRDRAVSFGADPERVYVLHNGIALPARSHVDPLAAQSSGPDAQPAGGRGASGILYTRFAGVQPAEVAEVWRRVRAVKPDATLADALGLARSEADTRAALIARGLAELIRLGTVLGARRETFMGLAGLGDLVLTCTDDQSRNRRLGLALARGYTVDQALAEIGQEVEGIVTARAVRKLATRYGVSMPIAEQVHAVLYEGCTPFEATRQLLERARKAELDES